MDSPLPRRVEVIIEVPRGNFVKRELQGRTLVTEYLSPLPCPFNYGCSPDLAGDDGDPLDVVVLGPRMDLGSKVSAPVVGIVRFQDAGRSDDKLIASELPPTPGERLLIDGFFRVYAKARRLINLAKGLEGRTAFLGLEFGR